MKAPPIQRAWPGLHSWPYMTSLGFKFISSHLDVLLLCVCVSWNNPVLLPQSKSCSGRSFSNRKRGFNLSQLCLFPQAHSDTLLMCPPPPSLSVTHTPYLILAKSTSSCHITLTLSVSHHSWFLYALCHVLTLGATHTHTQYEETEISHSAHAEPLT